MISIMEDELITIALLHRGCNGYGVILECGANQKLKDLYLMHLR